MSDPRFPIGAFEHDRPVTAEARARAIADLEALPAALRAAVRGLDGGRLDTPYRPGGWTLRQVVHHVADSHLNGYVRTKLALTEESPTIKPYSEDRWAALADASTLPVEGSLKLIEALHERWAATLRALAPADFARAFHHPESGRLVRLDTHVAHYAWHGRHHVAHIERLREDKGWR